MIRKNKRGQVAIWAIVGVVLIGSIIIFFLLGKTPISSKLAKEFEPKAYLDNCVKESVEEVSSVMLLRGGFINNPHNIMFNNINVSYICYNKGNYVPCINQHPMLLNEMSSEIENYLSPRINECIKSLKDEAVRKGGSIEANNLGVEVSLGHERIFVKLIGRMIIAFEGSVYGFEHFDVEVLNPLYNLGFVAMEIASQEAKYCYFSYDGYMILYPRFDIRKHVLSDSNKVYSIKDKKSGKIMNIGIRGCAIPAGI